MVHPVKGIADMGEHVGLVLSRNANLQIRRIETNVRIYSYRVYNGEYKIQVV